MSNWFSFESYPPIEMLMRPFADFIKGDPSSEALTEGQDSSPTTNLAPFHLTAPVDEKPPELRCEATAVTTEVKEVTAVAVAGSVSAQRTSVYRGVTRHRWTGRYEAHLWDNTCKREGQKRKGRQDCELPPFEREKVDGTTDTVTINYPPEGFNVLVKLCSKCLKYWHVWALDCSKIVVLVYLGGYDSEQKAARAYDLAALKYWGVSATTNFPASSYCEEMEIMRNMTKQEFVASIRRNSSGFSRGASIYRGVTRHHQHGRWQARIGRVAGNKDLYLGTFSTEEEAAEAYDVAAIKFRGSNAVTNFALSRYDTEAIANSKLPVGSPAKRMKRVLKANTSQLTNEANAIDDVETMDNFGGDRAVARWVKSAGQVDAHSVTLENPNNGSSSAQLHNFFEIQSGAGNNHSVSLAYYGLGESITDLCWPSFYWNVPNNGGEILQLTT